MRTPKTFRIGGKSIGESLPCFIIAEAGVNHNGSVKNACKLVTAAKKAGADAVKFQTFKVEKLVARGAPTAEYQSRNTGCSDDQLALLRDLQIDERGFRKIAEYAKSLDILFLSTPDEEESADFLDSIEIPAFKIGSGEVTNVPFLEHIARKMRPIILSTGMATLAEVAVAVEVLQRSGNRQIVLMHCVSAYPAPYDSLNLRAIRTLSLAFGLPCGYSDHSLDTEASVAAVALGALVIEKHLTLDTGLPGPDHSCSLDPEAFARMVKQIRNVERALGHGRKEVSPIELNTRQVVRKGIVAARKLPVGQVISPPDLALKRVAGEFVLPADLEKLVGLRLTRGVDVDQPISWRHFKS